MKTNILKYVCTVLVSLSAFVPSALYAAGLAASTDQSRYEIGDRFLVQIRLQTDGTPVNAVSGSVVIPRGLFEVTEVRYGGSVVSLWAEKPTYDAAKSVVSFSGGIPGGFNGLAAPLFTLTLKAIGVGKGTVAFKDAVVLKNDGTGSPYVTGGDVVASVAVLPVTSHHEPTVSTFLKDETSPELFVPIVWFDPGTDGGSYLVSFNAYDADSGIDHYEVKETPRFLPFGKTEWTRAENLYVLKNQMWITDVSVRAFDHAGNIRESTAAKPFNSILQILFGFIAAGVIIILIKMMKKKYRPARKKRVQ